jgi:hypothetical protein
MIKYLFNRKHGFDFCWVEKFIPYPTQFASCDAPGLLALEISALFKTELYLGFLQKAPFLIKEYVFMINFSYQIISLSF